MISETDLAAALDRIARTSDGELLYCYLQKVLSGVLVGEVSDGALRADLGRRNLASELMGHMAHGMDESGGRVDESTGNRRARPVVFLAREPANLGRRQSIRDRLAAGDAELGQLIGTWPGSDQAGAA